MPLRSYVREASEDRTAQVRLAIRREVLDQVEPAQLIERRRQAPEEVRGQIRDLTAEAAARLSLHLSEAELDELRTYVLNEILGHGPIEELLSDDSITEIMVNGPHEIWVERVLGSGPLAPSRLERVDERFADDAHVIAVLDRMLREAGRRVDESSPIVDVQLPARGYRVHAVIPPLSLRGPSITIRKFTRPFSLDDLVASETLTRRMADFLAAAVRARANILVSGGTGSGKTTLLNALSAFIGPGERVVTIEDTAELQFSPDRHVVGLQARPPGVTGAGAVTIRDLVISALRMRPDRIVVGEVRGGEAFDMLQAMNTGHAGSLTTVHANDPSHAIRRLEAMALMAGVGAPLSTIHEQIASAIHLIVQTERGLDGRRRVVAVAELDEPDARGVDAMPRARVLARSERGDLHVVEVPVLAHLPGPVRDELSRHLAAE